MLHPRAQVDWLDAFARKPGEEDPGWPFGRVFGWGEEREFAVTRLLVLPKGRVTAREARNLHGAAEDWNELLATWIEVLVHEDLHRERVKVEKTGQSVHVWVDRGKDPGELLKGKHTIRFDFSGGALAITPWQWGKMLAKASNGAQPPEAHVFLRDARRARNAGHFRRSVLDSATAAELGLAKLRDDALKKAEKRLAAYVRKNVRQINNLAAFVKAMGGSPPENITEDIAEPRNKAIHGGREPDEETAAKAFVKAEEVVDLAFPWKKLLV